MRPLRPEQWSGRLAHELRMRAFRAAPSVLPLRLGRPAPVEVALQLPPPAATDAERVRAARRTAELGRALLAGHDVDVRAWAAPALPKLVRYHLHYLDAARDLVWAGTATRDEALTRAGLQLIEAWGEQNRARWTEGWEPYAVAARLQNLAQVAAWCGPRTPPSLTALLLLHGRYLDAWPETHLQANHLLKDWVALALGGLVLSGAEAERLAKRGLERVRAEVAEQVLPDGGHYERSPMYHLLILSDLLDLYELARARGRALPWLEDALERMGTFLVGVLHPDGELPLFNDAVIGQAPPPATVLSRFDRAPAAPPAPLFDAPDTGLTALRGQPGELLVVDSGPLGPPHQPGHAHSDTLSYELSVNGRRCAVNAGMDGYQSEHRPYFRSAEAHNTVTVDGTGPDELWAAFRVGGRSRMVSRQALAGVHALAVRAELEAFQGWTQRRTLVLVPGEALVVLDEVSGAPEGARVVSRARLVPGAPARFQPLWGEPLEPRAAPYAPRFGAHESVAEHAVSARGTRVQLGYALTWGAHDVRASRREGALDIHLGDRVLTLGERGHALTGLTESAT